MPVPLLRIDGSGGIPDAGTARPLLARNAGNYSVLEAGGLLLLAPDMGSGAGPREDEIVALAGALEAMPLLGLLNMLGQNRETGRLVIRQGRIERVIMLRDGDVSSVGSNAPEDRLGQFLVKLGKITEQQLDTAVAAAGNSGGRLGQALVSQGLLNAHDLWSTIQGQITDIFADVVNWEIGSFVLFRSTTEYRFPSTPPLSMQGLLLEAVRRADEMSKFRERVPDFDSVIQKTGKPLPADKDVEEIDRKAFNAFDQSIRISDLARLIHVSEFDTTRCVYTLLKKKCVSIVEEEIIEATLEPYTLTPADAAKLEVYNLAFREIRDEVVRNGQLEGFMQGTMKYLTDPNGPHAKVFGGVLPDPGGALDVNKLVENLSVIAVADPWNLLQEALNELTFFMLFQCGELLDAQSDENLGRRVRLIHSALSGNSAI
jgi:hypothetical protein